MIKLILIFLALLGVSVGAIDDTWKQPREPRWTLETFKAKGRGESEPTLAVVYAASWDLPALVDLVKKDPKAMSASCPIIISPYVEDGAWNQSGWMYVARYGDLNALETIDKLIPGDWQKHKNWWKETPAMHAAGLPSAFKNVKYFVEHGADINAPTDVNTTLLDYAIAGRDRYKKRGPSDDTDPGCIVKYLLSKGAKTYKELYPESATQAALRLNGKPRAKKKQ